MNDTNDTAQSEQRSESGIALRLLSIIHAPRSVAEHIKIRPDWIIPLLVTILLSFAIQYISKPYFFASNQYEKTVTEIMEETEMDYEAAENIMRKNVDIFMPLSAIVFTPLIILFFSGLLFLGGNVIMGGETDFKTMFSLNSYTGFLGVVGMLVKLPLIIAKGSTDVITSFAIIVPVNSEDTFLFKLLSLFDVIVIWQSIVLAIGLAIIYGWTQKKANTLVASIWGLVVVGYGIYLGISG